MNLERVESNWNLDPRKDTDRSFGQIRTARVGGNQISGECNLIYRRHSTSSFKDECWLEQHIPKPLSDTKAEDMSIREVYSGMHRLAARQPSDPSQKTWSGLQRHSGGYIEDADLVKVLTEATEDRASSFRTRRVPVTLRVIEVMRIRQARA